MILGVGILLALATMWLTGRILLLLFCGVLLAVFLGSLADAIGAPLKLPRAAGLALALFLLCTFIGGIIYFLAPQVAHQSVELWHSVGTTFTQLHTALARRFPDIELPASKLPSASQLTEQLFGLTSSVVGMLVRFGIVLFVGIYAAVDPDLYVRGFLRLFRGAWRQRIDELLSQTSRALRWWLLGRAIAMASVGLLVIIGLWIGGVRLAFTLGLLAGLLTFVPYVGAIVSAIPAILIAFAQGPGFVLYALAVFLLAHVLEAYVIVPVVQHRVIHLPPVFLLAAQAIMGTLFGLLGVALAAPLAATGMVAVRVLYLRDTEGEPHPDATTVDLATGGRRGP